MTHYHKITANSYIISLGNTGAHFSDPLCYCRSALLWIG